MIRTDPISDEEVSYLQAMKDQSELADFDRYVNSLVDPRKPGNLKWLMEIYPEFVNRRLSQVHTDYEYALRNQLIDSWGINTFDDLHFKYLVDQGKVKGPHLQADLIDQDAGYSAGYLSPFQFKNVRYAGVRLPFASARFGRSADSSTGWTMPDGAAVFGKGRRDVEMAAAMYNDAGHGAVEILPELQRSSLIAPVGCSHPATIGPHPGLGRECPPSNYSKLEMYVSTKCTREARVRGDDGPDGDGECMVPLLRRGGRSSGSSLLRRVPKRRVPRGRKHPPLLPPHPRPGRRVEQAFSSRSISSRNRCRPFLMSTVAEFLTEKMNNMARWVTSELGKENMSVDLEAFISRRSPTELTAVAGMLSASAEMVTKRDWEGLMEADIPPELQGVIPSIHNRVEMHDKFWRYLDLFIEVISNS